jgi:excisionase family DNA binding protein
MSDGRVPTEYLTVEEAAVEFRLSESAVYRALREQRLPGVKILGRWRISRTELIAHVVSEGARARARQNPMPTARRRPPANTFRAKVVELRRHAG